MMEITDNSEQMMQLEQIESIFKEILTISPEKKVQIQKMTQGITNLLYKCTLLPTDHHPSLLFKFWGPKTEVLINRQDEAKIMIYLHEIGQFPKVYRRFPNGIVYGWSEGRTLKCDELSHCKIYPLIAKTVRKWHQSIDVSQEDSSPQKPAIISMIRKVHQQCLHSCPLPPKLIEDYCGYLESLSFEIVFCHNDLLAGNIILSPDETCVKLIDFEYAGWNWRSFELANHFVEFCDLSLEISQYPPLEFRRSWIREYLGQEATNDKEAQIEHEIRIITPAVNLFWALWALVQSSSSKIEFDYEKFAKKRFILFSNPHLLH